MCKIKFMITKIFILSHSDVLILMDFVFSISHNVAVVKSYYV